MDFTDLVVDAFNRISDLVRATLDGLDPACLTARVDPDANTIAWLIWHLTRVQDDHISELANQPQAWTADGWHEQFALPFGVEAIGYGQSSAEVGMVDVSAGQLTGYHQAVHARTVTFVNSLTSDDLDRIVDRRWNPPVTLAARMVSVLSDDLQHVGQAAYVRGVLSRRC